MMESTGAIVGSNGIGMVVLMETKHWFLHRKQPCEEHVWLVKDAVEIRNGVLVKKKCMVCGKKLTEHYWKETVR